MKQIIAILLICYLSPVLYATEQEADILLYEGTELFITHRHMDSFISLGKECTRKFGNKNGVPTSCYRGYIAKWEIKNDSLYLVQVMNAAYEEVPLSVLYPNLDTSNGVFAYWCKFFIRAGTYNSISFYKYKNQQRIIAMIEGGIVNTKMFYVSPLLHADYSGTWSYEDEKIYLWLELKQTGNQITGHYTFEEKNKASSDYPTHQTCNLKGEIIYETIVGNTAVNDWRNYFNLTFIQKDSILLIGPNLYNKYDSILPKQVVFARKAAE